MLSVICVTERDWGDCQSSTHQSFVTNQLLNSMRGPPLCSAFSFSRACLWLKAIMFVKILNQCSVPQSYKNSISILSVCQHHPTLEAFKRKLDNHLSDLLWFAFLQGVRGWTWWPYRSLPTPLSYDSVLFRDGSKLNGVLGMYLEVRYISGIASFDQILWILPSSVEHEPHLKALIHD